MESGTKQHIITPLSGLCNTPSDFACDDNTLFYSEGLRYVDGELKPIQTRKVMDSQGYTGKTLVFVHEYNGSKRLIFRDSATSPYYLYWCKEGDETFNKINISGNNFQKIVAVGNTLVVLYDGADLIYATWNGSGYSVSTQSLHPDYHFSLYKVSGRGFSTVQNTDSENYIEQDVGHTEGCFRTDNSYRDLVVRDDMYGTCLDKFKTIRNELLEDVYERKHFVHPFFAVAAIKLFDGTYKFIGSPQLMLPFTKGSDIIYYYNLCGNNELNGIDVIRGALVGEWSLHFTQKQDLSGMNTNINGVNIISSIDIFVTRPVPLCELYDGKDEVHSDSDREKWKSIRSATDASRDRVIVDKDYQSKGVWEAPYMLNWSWSADSDERKDYWMSTFDVYHRKEDKELRQDLLDSLGQFRKIASIPFDDSGNGKLTNVALDDYLSESTLKTLDNQELLVFSDKYEDWAFSSNPDDIDAINRRLIKVGGRQGFMDSKYLLDSSALKFSKGLVTDVYIYYVCVTLQTIEGTKNVWSIHNLDSYTIPLLNVRLWYYYPDPRAVKFSVYRYKDTDEKLYLLVERSLKHDSPIGGSYYFDNYPMEYMNPTESPSDTGTPVTDIEDNTHDTVPIANRVTQSPADNVFNDATKTYVGQGDIIKLASLTTALTQDAYKVSTVIAFTTQGIWSITCDSSGTFTSVSPAFSREVCINRDSVVMTDDKIYFASKKGIMCVVATSDKGVDSAAPKWSMSGVAQEGFSIYDGAYDKSYEGTSKDYKFVAENPNDGSTQYLYDYYECINAEGCYVYDYYSQAILLLHPKRVDYFVYDLASATMFYCKKSPVMLDNNTEMAQFVGAVDCFPDEYLVYKADASSNKTYIGKLSDTPLRHDDSQISYDFELVSRPMKLEGALYLKSLRRLRLLSTIAQKDKLSIQMFGSSDLAKPWAPIESLRGRPYRFFRYWLKGTMNASDSIDGLMLETQVRYTDKPH